MEWGERAEWLADLAEEDGIEPKALIDRPDLPEHLIFAWDAFWRLSGDRQLGFGSPGPIQFASIDRYAERFGILATEEFDRFCRLVRAMDDEWRRYIAKKLDEGRKK
ncbi:phage tail assembly chaperone [Methylobacterium sp. Leaf106]|uniref:phage tail assembly chaperone n=1 Tax=Methylobacterium sp. Leaf106 TaxID=1736255 RepID=UPI003FCC9291